MDEIYLIEFIKRLIPPINKTAESINAKNVMYLVVADILIRFMIKKDIVFDTRPHINRIGLKNVSNI